MEVPLLEGDHTARVGHAMWYRYIRHYGHLSEWNQRVSRGEEAFGNWYGRRQIVMLPPPAVARGSKGNPFRYLI